MFEFNYNRDLIILPLTITKTGVSAIWCSYPNHESTAHYTTNFWLTEDVKFPPSIFNESTDGYNDHLLVPVEGWYLMIADTRSKVGGALFQVIAIDDNFITLSKIKKNINLSNVEWALLPVIHSGGVYPPGEFVYKLFDKSGKPKVNAESLLSKSEVRNIADLKSSGLPFVYKAEAHVALLRMNGKPSIDFYPSTNKWRVSEIGKNVKYMTGTAKDFLKWFSKLKS